MSLEIQRLYQIIFILLAGALSFSLFTYLHWQDWLKQMDTCQTELAETGKNTSQLQVLQKQYDLALKQIQQLTSKNHQLEEDLRFLQTRQTNYIRDNQQVIEAERDFAANLVQLALLQKDKNAPKKALALFQQSAQIRMRLLQQTPNFEMQQALIRTLDEIASLSQQLNEFDLALTAYQQSLTTSENFLQQHASNTSLYKDISITYEKQGDLLVQLKKLSEASHAYQQSLTYAKKLVKLKETAETKRDLAIAYDKLGEMYTLQENDQAALKAYEIALNIRQQLAQNTRTKQAKVELKFSQHKVNALKKKNTH